MYVCAGMTALLVSSAGDCNCSGVRIVKKVVQETNWKVYLRDARVLLLLLLESRPLRPGLNCEILL